MKLSFREIEGFVKSPPAASRAVLIYGPDEGLARERAGILAKAAGGGDEISGDALREDPARLLDAAKSLSLLGDGGAVRIRGGDERIVAAAAKAALPELKKGDNFVIIEAGELGPRSALRLLFEGADNAHALPCYVEDARDLARILSEQLRDEGYRIAPDALQLLAAAAAGDRALARNEAEKLMLYMGPQKAVDLADVEASAGGTALVPLDDLARHTASGRYAEADRILTLALAEGMQPVAILRALQNHFFKLFQVKSRMNRGEGQEEALRRLKPPLFFKHKPDFESQLHAMSLDSVSRALNAVTSAEARCKQTGSLPDLILSRLVLALSQSAARKRA